MAPASSGGSVRHPVYRYGGLLERARRQLNRRDVVVRSAGRTDAGVHALGQVASFTLDRPIASDVLLRAVNARFPDSVRIVGASEVPVSFHARFAATGKRYRYRIWNADLPSPFERAYAWHVPGALDSGAMHGQRRFSKAVTTSLRSRP